MSYRVDSLEQVERMSRRELRRRASHLLSQTPMPAIFWIAELERRDRRRHSRLMLAFTAIVTLATIVNVVLFAWSALG